MRFPPLRAVSADQLPYVPMVPSSLLPDVFDLSLYGLQTAEPPARRPPRKLYDDNDFGAEIEDHWKDVGEVESEEKVQVWAAVDAFQTLLSLFFHSFFPSFLLRDAIA